MVWPAWFNPRTNRYALYTRQTDGLMQRRGINRSETADFANFPPSVPVIESSPTDPPDWDYYYNGFLPWPGLSSGAAQLRRPIPFRHHGQALRACDELLTRRTLGAQAAS